MDATHTGRGHNDDAARFLKTVAMLFGAVFLLVGIAGFIPGITTNYDQMQFAGHESEAMLIGLFQVSILHNIVHLLFGIVGLAVAKNPRAAAHYLIWGGAIYALLWIYGLVIGHESTANFVPLNTADNWLHFFLAAAMLALGFIGKKKLDGPVGTQAPA
ncbi:DUF4383 domain-containing protein [Nocardioides sp. SYSU DS0663]|uniref:DUF4383 domain-containing protein n=1 Tax=Nocardioides sp. SYSU DS0663 TaxID=3416445 RepID=UPI003F4C7368